MTFGADERELLSGGRVTTGVVRIAETVRRPARPNSSFVRQLLTHLERQEFDATPRYLGTDGEGREVFTFLPGEVPPELNSRFSDQTLADAAQLIRRFHDATADSSLAAPAEVVCHNDLSPCNFVFRDGKPVGIIDFDNAAPGSRLFDLGYAIFLWLNLGTDGPAPGEQARRIRVFCDSYGRDADEPVIAGIISAVAANIERLRADRRVADTEWWQAQLDWVVRNRADLAG